MQLSTKRSDQVMVAVGPNVIDRVADLLAGKTGITEPELEAAIRAAGYHPELDASTTAPRWRLVDQDAATVGVVTLLGGGAR